MHLGVRGKITFPRLRDQHLPTIGELRLHVFGCMEHGPMMLGGRLMPIRRDQITERSEQFPARGFEHVKELRGHQIERTTLRIPLRQVGFQPFDVDALALDVRLGAAERHRRDVGAGDLPPATCQPQSVGTFAATDVECRARFQVGGFGNQLWVGISAPARGAFLVQRVPELCVRLGVRILGGIGVFVVIVVFVAHAPRMNELPQLTQPSLLKQQLLHFDALLTSRRGRWISRVSSLLQLSGPIRFVLCAFPRVHRFELGRRVQRPAELRPRSREDFARCILRTDYLDFVPRTGTVSYAFQEAGPPWIVLGLDVSADEFWSEIDDDADLHGLGPTSPLRPGGHDEVTSTPRELNQNSNLREIEQKSARFS
eukprot:gene24265-29111_t